MLAPRARLHLCLAIADERAEEKVIDPPRPRSEVRVLTLCMQRFERYATEWDIRKWLSANAVAFALVCCDQQQYSPWRAIADIFPRLVEWLSTSRLNC